MQIDKRKNGLIEILGDNHVLENPRMEKNFSPNQDEIHNLRPHFKVKPTNADDVQKIVVWANQTSTPLVPVSSGEPHLRGDSIPSVPESLIVDLSGMNKILKIDRRNRLVLIQPGVTYDQLLPKLKKEGLRINMPLMPRRNKSVIASLLEREPVISPKFQWNLLEPLRSLEIIWGNGDKFYSGGGILRGEKESDWKQGLIPVQGAGSGPNQADFYKFVSAAQGSMGIITWASVKCEVLPELRKLYFFPSDKLDDLIDFTYKLLKFRFGDELFILNNNCLSFLLSKKSDEIEIMRNKLPSWTVISGITGGKFFPDEQVEAQESDIRDIAEDYGVHMVPEITECTGNELFELMLKPSEDPYWKLRYKGNSGEIFFLTTLDKTPNLLSTMQSTAREYQYPISDIGVYIQPAHQGVTCHCEFLLPFNHQNQGDFQKTKQLFRSTSYKLFKQGAFFSRPYGIWADMVYNADARTMFVTQNIKKIFDPNNIMNPGKLCF